jgi:DNA invertase Pin-like site-specific DNA recombinase
MTHVSIYSRISDDPTGKALGVDRQVAECRQFAAERGWEVRDVLIDNDLSATNGKTRPAFEQLLASEPEAILVWHTDRLVRLTRDLERVIELNVNVFAIHAGHLDLSTPAGRAVARTVTAWATYEGEQKSERQRAAHRQRVATGKAWWPVRPFGFERDGTLREEEAAYIRKAYDQIIDGDPLAQVARDWNAAGLRTRSGSNWRSQMVRQVLVNSRNAGIYSYRGEEVGAGAWIAIVSEDTYRATMRVLSEPSRRVGGGGPRQNLLSGVARCDKCDAVVRVGTRGEYKVYECTGKHCVSPRRDWTDWYVQEVYLGGLTDPELRALLSPSTVDVDALKRELRTLRTRLEAMAEDYAAGLISRAQMVAGTKKVQSLIRDADKALSEAGRALPEPEDFSTLSVHARRKLLDEALDIRILPRGKGNTGMSPDDFVIRPKAHPAQRIWMPLLDVPEHLAAYTVLQRYLG